MSRTLCADFGHFPVVFLLMTLFASYGDGNLYGQSMSVPRQYATSTQLNDGRVLVAGGTNGNAQASADVYVPGTGTGPGSFVPTGALNTARYGHTASLLHDGRVLVAGGWDASGVPLALAEIYDPSTGVFTTTGSMNSPRGYHGAAVLPDGRVLIAGGLASSSLGDFLATAEIYDPSTGVFTATRSMRDGRYSFSMTALNNGLMLVAGGFQGLNSLSTAEVYDPATGVFSPTGPMTTARGYATATLLNGGRVLLAGGRGVAPSTAEVFDPNSGTFTATGSMGTSRTNATATLLTSGQVLLAGGSGDKSSELYDPVLC